MEVTGSLDAIEYRTRFTMIGNTIGLPAARLKVKYIEMKHHYKLLVISLEVSEHQSCKLTPKIINNYKKAKSPIMRTRT